MTVRLARFLTLACALAALLMLSLHVMPPAGASAAPAGHAAHGGMDRGGLPAGQDASAACALHCLVAAVLPAAAVAPEPRPRR